MHVFTILLNQCMCRKVLPLNLFLVWTTHLILYILVVQSIPHFLYSTVLWTEVMQCSVYYWMCLWRLKALFHILRCPIDIILIIYHRLFMLVLYCIVFVRTYTCVYWHISIYQVNPDVSCVHIFIVNSSKLKPYANMCILVYQYTQMLSRKHGLKSCHYWLQPSNFHMGIAIASY